MKALIKDKPTRGANFTDLPFPKIGENDLLVRVQAAAFAESLRTGQPFETDRLDNLKTLRLVDDAYRLAGI